MRDYCAKYDPDCHYDTRRYSEALTRYRDLRASEARAAQDNVQNLADAQEAALTALVTLLRAMHRGGK